MPQQFQIEYELRARQNGYDVSDAGGRAYDAIWVLALALNHTMTMVKSGNINGTHCENVTGSLVPLEQFNYSNEKMGCLIQWNIQQTNISGVSVRKDYQIMVADYYFSCHRGLFSLMLMVREYRMSYTSNNTNIMV